MTKKSTPKAEKKPAAQTSMLSADGTTRVIRAVPLAEIQPDTRQPRIDDDKKAANVANICDTLKVDESGVARPIHAVQIRKTPPWAEDQSRPWMLFDGECRYLGATIKGAAAIDATVIEIPEEQVHEAQVLTAMARDGLGPDAMLTAIQRFDEEHPGLTAKDAAARLGMKTDVVRSLRKVVALPADIRARFISGELTLEVCEAISRIEGVTPEDRAERQYQAAKAVSGMAAKKAKAYVAAQFLLRLATAPFDREDSDLNPEAGVCSACPHRTGAQPTLFGETDEAEDCCTKPACWNVKVAAEAAKNPPVPPAEEEQKPKTKAGPGKPTKDDVLVAAALAAGAEPDELDAKSGRPAEEIDAALERLAAAGNPKARPALLDRQWKSKDLGGYSRGSMRAIGEAALDSVRDAMERLSLPDLAVFLRGIVDASHGLLTFVEPSATIGVSPLACEPGDEPPPPPPAEPNRDPWLDAPLTPEEQDAFDNAEREEGVPWNEADEDRRQAQ